METAAMMGDPQEGCDHIILNLESLWERLDVPASGGRPSAGRRAQLVLYPWSPWTIFNDPSETWYNRPNARHLLCHLVVEIGDRWSRLVKESDFLSTLVPVGLFLVHSLVQGHCRRSNFRHQSVSCSPGRKTTLVGLWFYEWSPKISRIDGNFFLFATRTFSGA